MKNRFIVYILMAFFLLSAGEVFAATHSKVEKQRGTLISPRDPKSKVPASERTARPVTRVENYRLANNHIAPVQTAEMSAGERVVALENELTETKRYFYNKVESTQRMTLIVSVCGVILTGLLIWLFDLAVMTVSSRKNTAKENTQSNASQRKTETIKNIIPKELRLNKIDKKEELLKILRG
ncbi:MAG TPA: hypothetical protein PKY78_02315 [Candidatus Omnitrophota bacterium]|nr:hypothetical protein [Candidatus Omnitrophota bacterium]HPS19807.1 hypothetical protein [Candidatus Omnitrophota bacterium]